MALQRDARRPPAFPAGVISRAAAVALAAGIVLAEGSRPPAPPPAAPAPPVTEDGALGGVNSIYTQRLFRLASGGPIPGAEALVDRADPISLLCVETPESRTYCGIAQFMRVQAPVSRVAAVLDSYSEYKEIFDDLVTTEVRSQTGNRLLVFSEQRVPVPLMANERDLMAFRVDRPRHDTVLYRYQLVSSNHLKTNDGFILLEPHGPAETAYVEFDFWDAHYGFAKDLGTERIWRDGVEGIVQADLAIKMKAENPGWPNARIRAQSHAAAHGSDFQDEIRDRRPWGELFP